MRSLQRERPRLPTILVVVVRPTELRKTRLIPSTVAQANRHKCLFIRMLHHYPSAAHTRTRSSELICATHPVHLQILRKAVLYLS
jgi:hypothetical protein